MDYHYNVRFDPVRLSLANAAAEEERRHRIGETVERGFEAAVLREYYKYQRMTGGSVTRLLILDPGEGDQPIVGRLETLTIGTQQDYSALSYVWGCSTMTETMFLHGKRLVLTKNLFVALKHFRLPTATRSIWIDQICINQKDTIERSQQVQLMHAIYKEATQVLVWLGPDTNGDASMAFQLCRSICSILDDKLLSSLCKKAGEKFDWIPKEYWKALQKLTRCSWFRRVWIPQEIGTETPAQIHWGLCTVSWDVLGEAMKKLDTLWDLKHAHGIDTDAVNVLYRRFVRPSQPLASRTHGDFTYQLLLSSHNEASDPRDYIFSQLGHYSAHVASEDSIIIEPDYDNSVDAIYHELAIRVLKTSPHLLLLNVISRPPKSTQQNTHPSIVQTIEPTWVPRWDQARLNHLIGYPGRYNASRGREGEVQFGNQFRHLLLKGIVVDVIVNVIKTPGPLFPDTPTNKDMVSSDWYGSRSKQTLDLAWEVACRTFKDQPGSTKFSSEPKYQNTSADGIEVFLDVFAPADSITAISSGTSTYGSGMAALTKIFPSSRYWSKKDPRKLVKSTGTTIKPSVWVQVARDYSSFRSFAVTERGYMMMAPFNAAKRDRVCVLFGGETPYVMRPENRDGRGGNYTLIGEAYVPGLMQGEAITMLEAGKLEEGMFHIH